MSLINCTECRANISDQASSCPKCGYPIRKPEYKFHRVIIHGGGGSGQKELQDLLKIGWEIVDQTVVDRWVDADDFDAKEIQYRLQR